MVNVPRLFFSFGVLFKMIHQKKNKRPTVCPIRKPRFGKQAMFWSDQNACPRLVTGLSIHFVHRYNGTTTKRKKRETLLPLHIPDDRRGDGVVGKAFRLFGPAASRSTPGIRFQEQTS